MRSKVKVAILTGLALCMAFCSLYSVLAADATITVGAYSLTYTTSETITPAKEVTDSFLSSDKLSENGSTKIEASGGQIVLKATSSYYYTKKSIIGSTKKYYAQSYSRSVTLLNSTDKALRINYSAQGMDEATSGSINVSNRQVDVLPGSALGVFSVTASPDSETDTTAHEKTGTITIHSIEEIKGVEVVFASSSYGTYSYQLGDSSVSVAINDDKSQPYEASAGSLVTLTVGQAVDGYEFYGWMASGNLLGRSDGQYSIYKDSVIYPVFLPQEKIALGEAFSVDNSSYMFWNDAVVNALATGKPVVVKRDYTLENDLAQNGLCMDFSSATFVSTEDEKTQFEIPSSVTVLVPYNDENTLCTTKPVADITTGTLGTASDVAWEKPTCYRKLTISSNVNIAVNGSLSLSGRQCSRQGSNGMPTKKTSFVEMQNGSSIVVNNGGNLYAWGYIAGSGEVTVKAGGKVYECFQLRDWRGGTAVSSMLGNEEEVFPVSQYYVQNIEVKMTIEHGAEEYAYTSLVATSIFADALVPFVGANGMFRLANGTIVKDYLEGEDRLSVEVTGDLTMAALVVTATSSITSYDMNSSEYVLPITNNLCVNVTSGTTIISQDMAFLPGTELIISDGAIVEVAEGVNVFIYDIDVWEEKLFVFQNKDVAPLQFVASTMGAPKARSEMGDAKIIVKGTLDVSEGYLYTTAGGANIIGEENGEIITGDPGTVTTTYQAVQPDEIGYIEIDVTPAYFKNTSDNFGEQVSTATHGENTYVFVEGVWHIQGCAGITETNTATCTEAGEHTVACSCYDVQAPCECHYKAEEIPALGHTWSDWTIDDADPTNHIISCDREGCAACVTLLLEYRLDNYIWLNAMVNYSGVKTIYLNTEEFGYDLVPVNDAFYLVRKIVAKDIPTEFTAVFTVDGKELDALKIDFATYKAEFETKYKGVEKTKEGYCVNDMLKMINAMITYGEAAKYYFDDNLTWNGTASGTTPTGSDKNVSSKAEPDSDVSGVSLKTSGANVYFDEALKLGVSYQLSEIPSGYTIEQIGLLVGDSAWSGELTTESHSMAYLVYNVANATLPGGSNNKPGDLVGSASGAFVNPKTAPTTGSVIFDLTSLQYTESFNLRPFVVLSTGEGENKTYYCVYGRQVGYSLEIYINRTYTKGDNEFKNLLTATWAYAQAAKTAFTKVTVG